MYGEFITRCNSDIKNTLLFTHAYTEVLTDVILMYTHNGIHACIDRSSKKLYRVFKLCRRQLASKLPNRQMHVENHGQHHHALGRLMMMMSVTKHLVLVTEGISCKEFFIAIFNRSYEYPSLLGTVHSIVILPPKEPLYACDILRIWC